MLTNDELAYWASERVVGPLGHIVRLMARELLAAREVVKAARASVANAALVCDEDCALADALKAYDKDHGWKPIQKRPSFAEALEADLEAESRRSPCREVRDAIGAVWSAVRRARAASGE